ncbi:TolC family protein [Candidatus Ichthyocystis hellenicum]|uniref:TolC family protein n=1 Tax=Candidatus Ichthyocystis hellenicum TaxID=1561003 RepID=UPI000B897058|nr:TolC family protein [Candidatus Ichthyocystis hellenicum]
MSNKRISLGELARKNMLLGCRFGVWCFLGLCYLAPQSLMAMTLYEAYHLSRSRDPSYLSAQANRKVADALVRQSLSGYMPSVVAVAEVNSSYPSPPVAPVSAQEPLPKKWYTDDAFSISAKESLFDAKVSKAVSSARLRAQAYAYKVQGSEYDLVTRLVDAYFSVLGAHEKLESLSARRRVILEQMRQAQKRFEAGSATIADVQYSQAQYSLSTADIVSAQAVERSSQAALRIFVGQEFDKIDSLSLDDLGPLSIKAINYPLAYWTSTARLKSPLIRSQELLLMAAKNDISLQKAGHFPTLEVTVSSRYDSVGLTSAGVGESQPDMFVGVKVTLPLFLGGSIAAKVDEYIHKSVAVYEDYRKTYNQVSLMTEQSYLNFRNGLNHINALKTAMASARTSLSANQLGYRTGTRILLDVLTAENQVYNLSSQLVDEIISTLKAYINLKIYAGVFSDEDLKFVDSCLVD